MQAAGPPGNAFELVYGGVTDRVRANMQAADPVLQEWIRCGTGVLELCCQQLEGTVDRH